jgi:hypothetical protein
VPVIAPDPRHVTGARRPAASFRQPLPPAVPALDPDELPVPAGEPPRHRLCPQGAPPIGLEFLGARATIGGYLMPCPCCVRGWSLLVPDGTPYGYAIALTHGCSHGCEPEHIAWWQLWRSMEMPPEPEIATDERSRRYATAAMRGELRELLERRPADPLPGLARLAYRAGQFTATAGFREDAALDDLLGVAVGLGLAPAAARPRLAQALAAGQARPRSIPA